MKRLTPLSWRRALISVIAACTVLASPSARADDQLYHQAKVLEELGDYEGAVDLYSDYLGTAGDSDRLRRARVKLPVLQEALGVGVDGALVLYLDALDARDKSLNDEALSALDRLGRVYPSSHLADDALYLGGYVLLMDKFDFAGAQARMIELRRTYPGSSYTDSSLYIEAIALEQSGDTAAARRTFQHLRDRHALVSLDSINLVLPKSSIQSRLWFDRAASRLENLDQHQLASSRIVEQSFLNNGSYERRVVIRVAGTDVPLLLNPSQVFSRTRFVNENNVPIPTGELRAFDGVVENRLGSWARVVFNGSDVQGLIRDGSRRFDLKTDTATGTLVDYNTLLADSNKIARSEGARDHAHAPIASSRKPAAMQNDIESTTSVVNRVVRMSLVIDSQYNDYTNGRGLFEAMTVTAIADGLYRDELGLALQAESVVVVSNASTDPMRIGDASMDQILHNFRDYRRQSPAIADESSLVYLLSGNRSNDNQVGLAFIDVACRTDGYDVSAATPYRQNFLLAAHEMAHNLGAEHDTDTQCAADNSKIMSPFFSADTQQEFSMCSRVAISNSLQGSCHVPAVDLQAAISHSSDSSLTAWVGNNDPSRPASAALRVSVPDANLDALPPGCAPSQTGDVVCELSSLGAGDTRELTFALNYASDAADSRVVDVNVEPRSADDALVFNNTSRITRVAGREYTGAEPTTAIPSGTGGGSLTLIDVALMLFLPRGLWLRLKS